MTYGITTPTGILLGLASRWTRFLGQMIDASIAGIPMFILTSVMRFGGRPTVGPAMIAMAVGAAWIFGERHQRLGDKVAGTIVVVAD